MIVFHVSQAFFNFIAMACFASVASFQAKWDVGPCTSRTSFTPNVSLTVCATRSWFVWVRRLCIGGQYCPLVVHAARAGAVREVRQTGARCTGAERNPCCFHTERKRNRSEFADCVRLAPFCSRHVLNNPLLQLHYNNFRLDAARVQGRRERPPR